MQLIISARLHQDALVSTDNIHAGCSGEIASNKMHLQTTCRSVRRISMPACLHVNFNFHQGTQLQSSIRSCTMHAGCSHTELYQVQATTLLHTILSYIVARRAARTALPPIQLNSKLHTNFSPRYMCSIKSCTMSGWLFTHTSAPGASHKLSSLNIILHGCDVQHARSTQCALLTPTPLPSLPCNLFKS